MLSIERLARDLVARRSEMERAVFDSPPADWPAFQKRLGAYQEIAALLDEVNEAMKGLEKDE